MVAQMLPTVQTSATEQTSIGDTYDNQPGFMIAATFQLGLGRLVRLTDFGSARIERLQNPEQGFTSMDCSE
jgi:hypothetical protein